MRINTFLKITIAFLLFVPMANYSAIPIYTLKKDSAVIPRKVLKSSITADAPRITATGNQIYCPGTSVNIVTDVTITGSDATDIGTEAIYIQISTGYVNGQDKVELANPTLHSNIVTEWSPLEGKLKLFSANSPEKVLYADFVNAIKDVVFTNSSTTPSGSRTFSITLGAANYLPRNGHYYEYFRNIGISWTAAKAAAETREYFGLKGYLATITAADEAQLAGEQANGAGWIGGSDAETEGVWKWVTGPEGLANGGTGTVFWNGGISGSASPNQFALWNTNEPNNSNGIEHYAHITAPGIGISGSWNDLQVNGDTSGNYQPKGYVVEYGGMLGDPILEISTSTTMIIPKITATAPASNCGPGTVTLQATASGGTINWYDAARFGNLVYTGNTYRTPSLNTTTTYYVEAGCSNNRTAITATIHAIPNITSTNNPVSRCGPGAVTIQATTTIGTVNWYSNLTSSAIIGTGTSLTLPNITQNTTYYAEAVNNGCTNGNRIAVDILIYDTLVVTDEELILCESGSLILDAAIPDMTYSWSTGETTKTIQVTAPGIYNVTVTNSANCSSTKKITVIEHDTPEIDRIDVNETTVVIYLKNPKDYFEYSVDGINYQSSNVFFNVVSGLQTAYAREINSCGIDSESFIVLIAPKFFTPNNDSYNDVWEIKGLVNYPKAEVGIFDRYGKFITKLNAAKPSWDGTFNKKLLPASDYWYVLKIDRNSPEKRGHFSLKR
ncbi:Ig-like domain-containing protein [Flavobacterium caseinilyticum]|uniref:T9SS type B sorting domain-containing protein n=1 Tax=Flavobacterium caseinilyticum TaxID=2541732 RepID=A0A4R5B2E4_9FLAO|nr:T9SS type B sorting domain-containing protein [Flavobacterium caseinilyticum]TDD78650.1 T9SS type B sorting domain-containing protein [Flavobacterium caseinilyticum]